MDEPGMEQQHTNSNQNASQFVTNWSAMHTAEERKEKKRARTPNFERNDSANIVENQLQKKRNQTNPYFLSQNWTEQNTEEKNS